MYSHTNTPAGTTRLNREFLSVDEIPLKTVHVNKVSGNDNNRGTAGEPWRTLAKVNSISLPSGGKIRLHGGQRHEGLIAPQSSGVTVETYNGGTATVSGGILVDTWTLIDGVRKIWRASLDPDLGRPRNLWVGGVRCVRPMRALGASTLTSTGISNGSLNGYGNPTDIEILSRMYWQEQRIPVTAVSGSEITLAAPAFSSVKFIYTAIGIQTYANSFYGIENAREIFIEQAAAGTFYHNRTTGDLDLICPNPLADPNTLEVIAPILETICDASNVDDVIFNGIEFAHTTTGQPTSAEGFVDLQGTSLFVGSALKVLNPSIFVDNGSRIKFQRCQMRALGNTALRFTDGCSDCEVVGNIIEDISGCGVMNGHPGHLNSGPSGLLINNNMIRRCGREFRSGTATYCWFGTDIEVSYNLIYDHPYSGIAFGLNGGQDPETPGLNHGHRVHHNRVRDCMKTLVDGGGIYCNNNSEDTIWYDNYVSRIGGGNGFYTPAMYVDSSANGIQVVHNVITEIQGLAGVLGKDDFDWTDTTSDEDYDIYDEVGIITPIEPLNVVGLTAAEAAGDALGAGLQLAYQDLDIP